MGRVRAAGVDLLDVRRWELAAQRCGEWLERRVCSPAERAGLPTDPAERLHQFGYLFSIKESVLKAIGGIPRGARFPDMSVSRPRRGDVSDVRVTGETHRRAELLGVELVAGALPIRDGLVLSWALALQPVAVRSQAVQGQAARDRGVQREEAGR